MNSCNKKVELLTPSKDKETAFAAIDAGCDALYIGAGSFGARKAAGNSLEDIKQIVDYAHKFYVKVHVTINTILSDEELLMARDLIHKLYDIGVDAIIVQDMGIFELAMKNELPPIPLHASTQCNTRTLEKAKFFDDLGVSRVILARELSLDKIKDICDNVECEVETFVHGALCVSYSGQCYLSYAIGGRSANRGECAQPCRKKYSLVDEDGNVIAKDKHLLSLKDFNASKHLQTLVENGVKSFKIEGRLKDKNYVKNVVLYYKKELEKWAKASSSGKVFTDFVPDLNKTFNRSYTDYFLEKRKNCFNFSTPKMVGEKIGKVKKVCAGGYLEIENSNLVNVQDGLCFFKDDELFGFLVNKIENGKIFPNKMPEIPVGALVFRNVDAEFDRNLENAKIKRRIAVDFEFKNNTLFAVDEDENVVSIEFPENEIPKNYEKMEENFKTQLAKTGESDFYLRKISVNGELPFIPVSKINEYRREILDILMQERLKNYPKDTQKPLNYTQFLQNSVDYKANVHNEIAKNFYKNCGCETCEMSMESGQNCTNVELMRTKHCLKYAFNMCKSSKKLFLIDEKGKKYPLKFDCKNCEMIVEK